MVLETDDDESPEDDYVEAVQTADTEVPQVFDNPRLSLQALTGIQWLKSLGPILWDFDKLQMEFTTNGRKFLLRDDKTPSFKVINNKTFAQAVNKGADLCFLSTSNATYYVEDPTCHTMSTQSQTHILPEAIATTITKYADMFEEPIVFPLIRPGFDHKIPLKEGSQPFNLRPYRFSVIQKDIINNIMQTLLDQGIVHPSNSPFSSPTILVCKKDGSW